MEKIPQRPSLNVKENIFRANRVAEILSEGIMNKTEAITFVLEEDGITDPNEIATQASHIGLMLPQTPAEADTTLPTPFKNAARKKYKAMIYGTKQAERSRRDDRYPPD